MWEDQSNASDAPNFRSPQAASLAGPKLPVCSRHVKECKAAEEAADKAAGKPGAGEEGAPGGPAAGETAAAEGGAAGAEAAAAPAAA